MSRYYLLTDPLPDTVWVSGRAVSVCTDFRLFVAFERSILAGEDRFSEFLLAFYPKGLPSDVDAAADAFFRFYLCGETPEKGETKSCHGSTPYSFSVDDAAIYAAFLREYGIRLQEESLHWYEFRALFLQLMAPDFSRVVSIRMTDVKDLKGEEKKEALRLKNQFAIHTSQAPKNAGEHEEQLIAWAKNLKKGGE